MTETPEKTAADQVEAALHDLACGYEYIDNKGEKRFAPPDLKAVIYYLEHVRPEKWGGQKKTNGGNYPLILLPEEAALNEQN